MSIYNVTITFAHTIDNYEKLMSMVTDFVGPVTTTNLKLLYIVPDSGTLTYRIFGASKTGAQEIAKAFRNDRIPAAVTIEEAASLTDSSETDDLFADISQHLGGA